MKELGVPEEQAGSVQAVLAEAAREIVEYNLRWILQVLEEHLLLKIE